MEYRSGLPSGPYWALLGQARAGPAASDAVSGAVYAFLGIARGEDYVAAETRLLAVMAQNGWTDITIDRADPLSPNGLPGDEGLLAALRAAALNGAAFVLFPEPVAGESFLPQADH